MSSHIRKKLKQGINALNAAYYSGLVAYPRVDNTYIQKEHSFDLFPHPPINKRKYKPLQKKDSLVVNKEEMMLYLSTIRIITPRQIETVYDYIDHYLDDLMYFRNIEKEAEAKKMVSLFEKFLKDEGLKETEILGFRNKFYKNCYSSAEGSVLFAQESAIFISPNDRNRTKCEYHVNSRQRSESSSPFTHKYRKITSSVTEAMHTFRDSLSPNLDNSIKDNIITIRNK